MQFGPIIRMPASRTNVRSSSSTRAPRPGFGESGTDHDQGFHVFGDRVTNHRSHRRRRDRDDRQIDGIGNVSESPKRAQSLQLGRFAMNRQYSSAGIPLSEDY